MKIMIIVKNLNGGGAERVASNLATKLSQIYDTILVVISAQKAIYETSAKIIDLKMPINKGKFKILWHLEVMNKVRKLKRSYGITHAISFLAEADLANVLSRQGDKVLVSVRNKRSSRHSNKLVYLKNKWVFKHADKIVSLSKMVEYDLVESFGVDKSQIVNIYNPCYKEEIQKKILAGQLTKQEKEFFVENKGKVVITAGRLEPQKGQWHLIRAFSYVTALIPDAKLLVLGKGEERDYLLKLITDLELDSNVYLLGQKKNPYIYLSMADIFAFPSIYEGLGNILIECMACELPIISVDCDFGPKELLEPDADLHTNISERLNGKYGVLIPPMDGKKYDTGIPLTKPELILAKTIVDMINNDKLRLSYKLKIKQRGDDFQPHIIIQQWIGLLNSM